MRPMEGAVDFRDREASSVALQRGTFVREKIGDVARNAPARGADFDGGRQLALTKLSSTFFRPACSKSISSLLPSMAAIVP